MVREFAAPGESDASARGLTEDAPRDSGKGGVETRGRCKAAEDALLAHPDAHHDVLTEIVGVTSGHTEVGNDAVRGGKKDARGGFDVGVAQSESRAQAAVELCCQGPESRFEDLE